MKQLNLLLLLCILTLMTGCQTTRDKIGEGLKISDVPYAYFLHSDYKDTPSEILRDADGFDIIHQIALHSDSNIQTSNSYTANGKITVDAVDSGLLVNIFFDTDNKLIYRQLDAIWQQIPTSISNDFYNNETLMSAVVPMVISPNLTIDTLEGPIAYSAESHLTYDFQPTTDILTDVKGIFPIITSVESTVYFDFTVQPTSKNISIINQETGYVFYEGPMEANALMTPDKNGSYDITLITTYSDSEINYYSGDIIYNFQLVYNHMPEPEVSFITGGTTSSINPGEMTMIALLHMDDYTNVLVSSEFKNSHDVYEINGTVYAVIATRSSYIPGKYPVTVTYNHSNETLTETLSLTLLDKEFPVNYLYVTASTASIKSNDNAINDQPYFDAAWASQIEVPLWEGPFIPPTEGVITTEYGIIRVTNDNWDNTSRHDALDIANKIGTPVYASNSGKVVMSHPLNITGNSIVIDHGLGLYSIYFHLNELFVSLDETVEKGQYIADMGTTGYSTGSHLHFAIRHNGVYLDPNKFYEEGYLPNFPQETP